MNLFARALGPSRLDCAGSLSYPEFDRPAWCWVAAPIDRLLAHILLVLALSVGASGQGLAAGPAWQVSQVAATELPGDSGKRHTGRTLIDIALVAPQLAGDTRAQKQLERAGVEAQYFVLPQDGQQPHRLVVDLPSAQWRVAADKMRAQGGLVDGFRFGQFSANVTRFVFELGGQSRVSDYQALLWRGQMHLRLALVETDTPQTAQLHTVVARPPANTAEGSSLEGLLVNTSGGRDTGLLGGMLQQRSGASGLLPALFAPRPQAKPQTIARRSLPTRGLTPGASPVAPQTRLPAAPVQPASIRLPNGKRVPLAKPPLNTQGIRGSRQQAKPIIVIDPGHGGKDPGTRSRRGLLEKDVTMAFGRALYETLKATGRYQVYLSRSSDRAVDLAARRRFAVDKKADLFLSIHADFVDAGQVSGATIYTLSHEASDQEALDSARRENGPDNLHASLDSDPEAAQELLSMGFRSQKNEADFAAKLLVDHLRSQWPLHKKPHKSAGFKVLKSTDVPSLLIEVGYMSNRNDLALMASPFEHRRFAALIAKGLRDYFER